MKVLAVMAVVEAGWHYLLNGHEFHGFLLHTSHQELALFDTRALPSILAPSALHLRVQAFVQ